MTCASRQMGCASGQNDLRSWQNDLRVISDATDVLEKMTCALTCALACALTCAIGPGVPVAQRISFSSDSQSTVARSGDRPQRGDWVDWPGGVKSWRAASGGWPIG